MLLHSLFSEYLVNLKPFPNNNDNSNNNNNNLFRIRTSNPTTIIPKDDAATSSLPIIEYLMIEGERLLITTSFAEASLFEEVLPTGVLLVHLSNGSIRAIECPLRQRPIKEEKATNRFFKKDLEAIRRYRKAPDNQWHYPSSLDTSSLLVHPSPSPSLDTSSLLVHPFLPIIGINQWHPEEVLNTIKHLISCLPVDSGCEVVISLNCLRRSAEKQFGRGETTVPFLPPSSSLPSIPIEWKSIGAFLWLDPLSFYVSPILSEKRGSGGIDPQKLWLQMFSDHGEKFKVLS